MINFEMYGGKILVKLIEFSPLIATDLQHLASSRPSEQSFAPSHTLLRGIQCPSAQRNWRGQAGDRQEGDLSYLPQNSEVKASGFTYGPLERRLGRANRSPCE